MGWASMKLSAQPIWFRKLNSVTSGSSRKAKEPEYSLVLENSRIAASPFRGPKRPHVFLVEPAAYVAGSLQTRELSYLS